MKQIIFLMFFTVSLNSQVIVSEGYDIITIDSSGVIRVSPKKIDTSLFFKPAYLLVYNENGYKLFYTEKPQTKSKIFETFEDLEKDLRGYSWHEGHKNTKYEKNSIVGIWDLINMKKIDFYYVEEQKESKEQVIIESKKWVDKYYILKK